MPHCRRATPLRRGGVAAASPPVHSVDPYSYLVRVPAGGLSGKVLLKQKGTLIAQFGIRGGHTPTATLCLSLSDGSHAGRDIYMSLYLSRAYLGPDAE